MGTWGSRGTACRAPTVITRPSRSAPFYLVLAALLVACNALGARPGPDREGPDASAPTRASGPKRLVVATASELGTFRTQLNRAAGGILAGAPELEQLVHRGLTVLDHHAVLQPSLAEAVPSLDNGLWRLEPDGRMETMWVLRPGMIWHDSFPFTTDDLLFSSEVVQDRELAAFRDSSFEAVERVEARDGRTFVVHWRRPYISADRVFAAIGTISALPLPRHLLEESYRTNKAGFTDLPYWSDEFVGLGPYKVREWYRGSFLVLDASDAYALGRPRIDTIEVKFIPDPSTLFANILGGAVDQPLGRGISFDQGMDLREQWRNGRVEFSPGSGIKVWPQLHNPNPAIIGDVRFRRALYHAIDRQQLVDTLLAGQSQVAHTTITPTDPEFRDVEASAVRYAYAPRRTAEILQGLGYGRGPDGMFRDGAGQPLTVEFRSSPVDLLQKTKLAVAHDWQTAGVGVRIVDDPPRLRGDLEYRATFPGFDLSRTGSGVDNFDSFTSREARTAQNRYIGQNSPNYMNPEFDLLVDRYLGTIPRAERIRVVAAIVQHMTDQVVVLDQFYDASAELRSTRVANVPTGTARSTTTTWNVHEWDITG